MGKLSKRDYERLVLSKRNILGPQKNKEGKEMAKALYLGSYHNIPTDSELKDFYFNQTNGHWNSITLIYDLVYGNKNPWKVVNELTREINIARSGWNTLDETILTSSEDFSSSSSSSESYNSISSNISDSLTCSRIRNCSSSSSSSYDSEGAYTSGSSLWDSKEFEF